VIRFLRTARDHAESVLVALVIVFSVLVAIIDPPEAHGAELPAASCNQVQPFNGLQLGAVTSVGYERVGHRWQAYNAGDVTGGYAGGLGLWPDASCTPRVRLELAGIVTGNASDFRASLAGGIALRVAASIWGGIWVAEDLYDIEGGASSGIFTPYTDLHNTRVLIGGCWHFGSS